MKTQLSKKHLKTNKMKMQCTKIYGMRQKQYSGAVYCDKHLYGERRKISMED